MSHELKNISSIFDKSIPDFIKNDYGLFVKFLKYYYQFLESGELTISLDSYTLLQETNTPNKILSETGTEILLEDSSLFQVGEYIRGSESGMRSKILIDNSRKNSKLFIVAQQRFRTGETIVGETSGATAIMLGYKSNPVQNIQQLLDYADLDHTIYDFLDKFKNSFLSSIPDTLTPEINRYNLIKNIKRLYKLKGTKKGHEIFFRMLFNETPNINYPRERMIRSSDGEWVSDTIIRVVENGTTDAKEVIGKKIVGQDSGAEAYITSITKFKENADTVSELNIDVTTLKGSFIVGETVESISNRTDLRISFTVRSIVSNIQIQAGGKYYKPNQIFTLNGTGNNLAKVQVSEVKSGGVDGFIIDNVGSGYQVGDDLVFDNDGTYGTGAMAKVSVVGGTLLMEDGSKLQMEPYTASYQQDSYSGQDIVIETDTFDTTEEATEINKIRIIDNGYGYKDLPLTYVSSTNGINAKIIPFSTSGVGSISECQIINFGLDYLGSSTIPFYYNIILKDISGTFLPELELVSHSGKVISYNQSKQLLVIETEDPISIGDTIDAGAQGIVADISKATGYGLSGTIGNRPGRFISDKGKISNDTMRIQDSFYYQDFSYVVSVGQSINRWRDLIKTSVHPAGWNVFGEVSYSTSVAAKMKAITAEGIPDYLGDETITPDLASTFETVFSTVFGRRLGTIDDGSTIRPNPNDGVSDISELDNNTRDVTLKRKTIVSFASARAGVQRLGSTLDLLPKYAFYRGDTAESNIPNYPGINRNIISDENNGINFTIEQFGSIKINEVSAEGTGEIPISAYNTKINVPPPGEIILLENYSYTLDNDTVTLDTEVSTWGGHEY